MKAFSGFRNHTIDDVVVQAVGRAFTRRYTSVQPNVCQLPGSPHPGAENLRFYIRADDSPPLAALRGLKAPLHDLKTQPGWAPHLQPIGFLPR